jgi:hypothetical protein
MSILPQLSINRSFFTVPIVEISPLLYKLNGWPLISHSTKLHADRVIFIQNCFIWSWNHKASIFFYIQQILPPIIWYNARHHRVDLKNSCWTKAVPKYFVWRADFTLVSFKWHWRKQVFALKNCEKLLHEATLMMHPLKPTKRQGNQRKSCDQHQVQCTSNEYLNTDDKLWMTYCQVPC